MEERDLKMVTITIKDIPAEVRRKFKVLCAEREESIRSAVLRFMEQEIQKAEQEKQK